MTPLKTSLCPHCQQRYRPIPGKVKCPNCGKMNFGESTLSSEMTTLLSNVKDVEADRIKTGLIDECVGGGMVRTTTVLIGGEPGAGKSTLSLQLADFFVENMMAREALYICSEETMPEVKLRAKRLLLKNPDRIRLLSTLSGNESLANLDTILTQHKPMAIFLDSLSGLTGDDLAMQVEFCKLIKSFCAKHDMPGVIIDHVTKDGDFAGLMQLQHAVDATLMFTVNHKSGMRILETIKNRHGRAHVSIKLDMMETGLKVHERREADYDDDDLDDNPFDLPGDVA